MKNLMLSLAALTTMAVAGVAVASAQSREPTDAEVQRAIDARLHAMLVKLNSEKK
jgi:hypothetical protein